MKNLKTILTASALGGLLLAAPSVAMADGFSFSFGGSNKYSLRFSPATLTLKQGATGTFKVDYLKRGAYRFSRPKDYRISVHPRLGASLSIRGDRFDFSSQVPGLYKISAAHDSGRAYRGATGSMWVRVTPTHRPGGSKGTHGHHASSPPRSGHGWSRGHAYGTARVAVLTRIRIFTQDGSELHGRGLASLPAGSGVGLRAVGYDRRGRVIAGFTPTWVLSSAQAGRVGVRGGAEVLLRVGRSSSYQTHTLTAQSADGRVRRVVRFRIAPAAWRRARQVARVVLFVKQGYYGAWTKLPAGAVISARQGQVVYLKALGLCAAGSPVAFSPSWGSGSSALRPSPYGTQTVAVRVGLRTRGSATITARGPLGAVGAQLTIWVR